MFCHVPQAPPPAWKWSYHAVWSRTYCLYAARVRVIRCWGGGVLVIAFPNARVDLQEVLLVAIYCFVCVWVFYVCYFVFLRRSGQWNLISGWWHNFHASVFLLYSLVTISPGVNQMIELWMYYKRRTTYNSLVAPQKLAAAVSYRR